MKLEGGRAESAPTLDSVESFVQGWYEDMEVDAQEEIPGSDRGNKVEDPEAEGAPGRRV